MSRFNQNTPGPTKTTNFAGGEAYTQSPELELISILSTSFAKDKFYEKVDDTFIRLRNVIALCDKKFVAQAAVYARKTLGMRSITHVVAAELAKHISGQPWAKCFYKAVINRPDDMMEIAAYYFANNADTTNTKRKKKGLPNAMKSGFAMALNTFNAHTLAKYQGSGKTVKLVDIVNMVHPTAHELNSEGIAALVKGELKSTGTWESELSAAGQQGETEDEKAEFKKDVWINLITEKKIGYFALLKNLRNIMDQAPEVLPQALESLTNGILIKKSLVLPFRFLTAFDEVMNYPDGRKARPVMEALNKAIDISLSNVPHFDGPTLVVLDTSSSMTENKGAKKSPAQIGALFAAVLCKANHADLITFDTTARYVNYNPANCTTTFANSFKFPGGGTDFHSIFRTAKGAYDRIVILSDMQGWMEFNVPTGVFNQYKQKYNCNPFIYSFDLAGYGTMQFPEKKVLCVAGFSEKVFDTMKLLEHDKNALINQIKQIIF